MTGSRLVWTVAMDDAKYCARTRRSSENIQMARKFFFFLLGQGISQFLDPS